MFWQKRGVLERIFPGRFTEEEKSKIGFEKEKQYQVEFERLNIGYIDCLVFEDAPKGAEAAQNAGMDYVVINLLLRLLHFLWHGYFMHNWLGIFSYNAGLSLVHS